LKVNKNINYLLDECRTYGEVDMVWVD